MVAKLSIVLSDDLLAALKRNKALKLSLAGSNGRVVPARGGRKAARKLKARRGGKKQNAAGGYREGSHPAKLLAFASGRKSTFGVAETMKALKVSRAHASMVLAKLVKDGRLRREGRGEYVAA